MLMRTLGSMNVNAAEVGERFDAARRIDERDPDGWSHERARVGEEMLRQTRELHDAIRSRETSMHVFALDHDGTHDHCMLDDHARWSWRLGLGRPSSRGRSSALRDVPHLLLGSATLDDPGLDEPGAQQQRP